MLANHIFELASIHVKQFFNIYPEIILCSFSSSLFCPALCFAAVHICRIAEMCVCYFIDLGNFYYLLFMSDAFQYFFDCCFMCPGYVISMCQFPIRKVIQYKFYQFHSMNFRLWESVKSVKAKHNRASKRAMQVLNFGINQTDMILAQWGFMGLVVTRGKFLGIHDDDEEGWKSFIHVWRVLGYAFGIQDQ